MVRLLERRWCSLLHWIGGTALGLLTAAGYVILVDAFVAAEDKRGTSLRSPRHCWSLHGRRRYDEDAPRPPPAQTE